MPFSLLVDGRLEPCAKKLEDGEAALRICAVKDGSNDILLLRCDVSEKVRSLGFVDVEAVCCSSLRRSLRGACILRMHTLDG